ncbi:MAG: peptidase S8/S53 subtilisin kexin sedolisin [Armatimonadota bacterium]
MALLGSVLFIGGCGGGGGTKSSGTGDRAPEPTCSRDVGAEASSQQLTSAQGFRVPDSTRERQEDVGQRLHTNHIVLRGAGRGDRPTGFTPQQIRTAYGITGSGSGAIAVVAAFDYVQAVDDFNVFSREFGLPTEPSTDPTANNAQLQVVYASGRRPTTDSGWNQEAALDIQWAHAAAPGAKIYLVEADSSSLRDLMAATHVAKRLPGVRQVSMSFGGTETSCAYATFDPIFSQSGVSFYGSSGDSAGERLFPSLSRRVICVGGTTLQTNGAGSRRSETVWNGAGGGISRFSPRPIFQDPVGSIVGRYRAGPDISAVANPQTGVSVYCSVSDGGDVGWLVIGGTSASTPIIAGIVNAAGRGGDSAAVATRLYSQLGSGVFFDIIAGNSGSLAAAPGYDIISGVGAPNGQDGF